MLPGLKQAMHGNDLLVRVTRGDRLGELTEQFETLFIGLAIHLEIT
jgi:hypothetical protein